MKLTYICQKHMFAKKKKEQNEHEIHLKMRLENMFFKVNAKLIKNPSFSAKR